MSPPKNASLRCAVPDCATVLQIEAVKKSHRVRACLQHQQARIVDINGQEQRFCQQCTRFHPLANFDGELRSCRERLSKLRLRYSRRKAKARTQEGQETSPELGREPLKRRTGVSGKSLESASAAKHCEVRKDWTGDGTPRSTVTDLKRPLEVAAGPQTSPHDSEVRNFKRRAEAFPLLSEHGVPAWQTRESHMAQYPPAFARRHAPHPLRGYNPYPAGATSRRETDLPSRYPYHPYRNGSDGLHGRYSYFRGYAMEEGPAASERQAPLMHSFQNAMRHRIPDNFSLNRAWMDAGVEPALGNVNQAPPMTDMPGPLRLDWMRPF